ncbi:MAG: PepSY domain-containing protein [Methylococcaceae bacterium]|nr:PepSY domain-containing protein [Methylococcaceae bacterium]MDP3902682.1 PepSY domain-containing protein [Methylococcaceae bacterium]
MKQIIFCTLFAGSVVFAANASADSKEIKFPKTKASIQSCIQAALKEHDGKVVKVEFKTEKNEPVYEFDIESADGKAWDIECSGKTGKVIEVEQEVKDAEDALFKAKVKVSEADARQTALNAHAGEIVEVEYEIEPDGAASYEFDIVDKDGKERKVEVDATSGKIVEDNEETFQIGHE